MNKHKIKYICGKCGYESLRWVGKCPGCEEWNTFTEELVETKKSSVTKKTGGIKLVEITDNLTKTETRIKTNITELDRVLGGGIIAGSIILIAGDPGIGKSTLVMQASNSINDKVLYITGEESVNQIMLRAKRLNITNSNISLLSETDLEIITSAIETHTPKVVIIDSIQTLYNPNLDNTPGTITQIRECTAVLMQTAKKNDCAIIIVGHVTKEGFIAGPKVLEHMVDAVLQFEGEKNHSFRIIRCQKNRFGSTNEIGVFEMREEGLVEIKNPSEIFLSERDHETTGSIITTSLEGSRAVLLEVQALVTPSNYGNPQRVATGFDYRRLSILLAVLEKRAGLRLSALNVFLNMAGGLRIDEPAVDLAVCCAIASNTADKIAKNKIVVIGEVGLGGEIRSVSHIEKRIQEAAKLGFKEVLIPKNNYKNIKSKGEIKITPVDNINSALDMIF